MMPVEKLSGLVAALWVGSLWTVGYLVAPTLFATLSDTILAGTIAGKIFRVEAWLSIVCAIVLLTLISARRHKVSRSSRMLKLVAGMLSCTLVVYFGLQPFMAALREAAPGGALSGAARMQFGMLHGVASGLYLLQSVLGIMLLLSNPITGAASAVPLAIPER